MIRHEMMRVVSFRGVNALNITLYGRIFIWGHRQQKGAAPKAPRGDAVAIHRPTDLVKNIIIHRSVHRPDMIRLAIGSDPVGVHDKVFNIVQTD